MRFDYRAVGQIVFGPGLLAEVPSLLADWGRRYLVVTGRRASRVRPLVELLEGAGLEVRLLSVPGEPTVALVEEGCRLAREHRVEGVVALGGGSAIDAGKAVAALVANPGEVLDYLEVIGRGRSLTKPALPLMAIPTTAGTGAEVTRNAVLASANDRVKVSLRSPYVLPRAVVVDPELSYRLPPRLTAATGLDALTQLVEAFVSCRANPMTDAVCREGLARVGRALPAAYRVACRLSGGSEARLSEAEKSAREEMAVGALFSGIALGNAGLGAVHGFAGPIGGMFPAPHGEVCAALLPWVMARNVGALRERAPKHEALVRYREVARLLCHDAEAELEDGLAWVKSLVLDFDIPSLRQHGISQSDIPVLVDKASVASSMKGNPVSLTTRELADLLEEAL